MQNDGDYVSESKPQFEQCGQKLLARAPAKINLSLLIADKRPDGFHNLETIMQKINFYDELYFEKIEDRKIELVCRGLWSPCGRENLVYRAAESFYDVAGIEPEIKIELVKNIPAGSGLGSASSDAATAVMALNKIYNQPLKAEQIVEICSSLGSDVAFFTASPMAFCSGRGEKIENLSNIFDFCCLLLLPDINTSTKKIYENFKPDLSQFGTLKDKIKPLLEKNKVDLITKMCANMLADVCFKLDNRLKVIRDTAERICRLPVALSGSGSAMYVVLERQNCRNAETFRNEIITTFNCNCIIAFNNKW